MYKRITEENSLPTRLQIVTIRMITGEVQTMKTNDVLIVVKKLIYVKITKYLAKSRSIKIPKNFTALNFND